jgi:hypothetical protein
MEQQLLAVPDTLTDPGPREQVDQLLSTYRQQRREACIVYGRVVLV